MFARGIDCPLPDTCLRCSTVLLDSRPAAVLIAHFEERILASYDLSRYTFTYQVIIDEKAIPHSHPVLTLHTRHLGSDEQFLSKFKSSCTGIWTLIEHRPKLRRTSCGSCTPRCQWAIRRERRTRKAPICT